jgi:S1-C subfamily serine protease
MSRTHSALLTTLVALASLALPVGRATAEEGDAVTIYQKTLKATALIATDSGRGTGWVADVEKRLIVTNHHVAGDAKKMRVFFPKFDGGELVTNFEEYLNSDPGVPARLLLSDPAKDLAVIQVERLPAGTTALKLADRSPTPGERVHALGCPGVSGALWVYSPGNVRSVYVERATLEGGQKFSAWVVESSLPVNPGDSGGPEVNDRGELVSVTSHGLSRARLITEGIDVREVKEVLKAVAGGERGVRGKKKAAPIEDGEIELPFPPKGSGGKKARPADEDDDEPQLPRAKRGRTLRPND